MRRRSLPRLALSLILLLCPLGGALAQGTTSRVTGVVQDATGAVVEGAAVTLTNEATNVSFTTQTSSTGTYSFDSVQVGTYTVAVEKQGFKRFVSTANAINVNQPATVNVALETGAVAETVTVTATAELVQTSTSGNFGNTVEERPLEALPIVGNRGRNPLQFILFQPGVVEGANSGGGVHVHGARDRAFNFTLDGIDINETSAGGSNFTPIRTNPDSLTQFQVITSNFTADNGRSSGAQVNLVTKSGTNEFHGNLFEFYQTPRFHANEYANTINTRLVNGQRVPTDKPQFVQHIFGGSLGGPVYLPKFGEGGKGYYSGKNRTFFFTNLQLLRTSQSFFVNRTVYTPQARQGIFRYAIGRANANALATGNARVIDDAGNPLFPNCSATVTQNCIATFNVLGNPNIPLTPDPTTNGLIGLTPLPNNYTVGDGLNTAGFSWVAPQTERQYDWTMKVDHNFNDRNAIFVRYSRGSQNTLCDNANGGLARFPGLPCFVDTFRTPRNLAVNYRATLTPTLVNEFVAGFNRFTFSFNNPDENWAANSPVILNIPTDPLNSSPGVNNARRITTKQFVDNLSWQKQAHTFKFGTNIRLQDHFDDRSSVASLNTRESVTLGTGNNSVPSAFGTTASSLPGATTANPNAGIASADRSRLDSFINDIFGRVGAVTRAFVAQDNSTFAPAGTRFLYTASYPEYDFYGQDTWKVSPRLTIDYGLRWEVRLSPRADNLILRPSTPVRFGEAPRNNISFEEGKLYKDSWKQFAPTVGFAWDPFGGGKTSVRGNYRLAWDRTNTFVFSSFIFQNAPGLTRGITLLANAFPGGSANALLRNGLPALSANDTTPLAFRTPPAYSVNSISVVDPNLTYPRTHQYGLSVQRELGWKSVLEVNYIGRLGRKLFGSYDANQVDISGNGFLNAFRQLQGRAGACDAATVLNPNFLINQLLVNDSRLQNTTTCGGVSRRETGAEFLIRQATGGNVRLANGGVATNIVDAGSAAQAAALVTTGFRTGNNATANFILNGFSPFFFQPYPQFAGAINVLENNDRSRYNALEVQVSRRYTGGFSYQASYTLSKSEDTRSYDPALTFLGRSAGGTTATFLSANTPFDLRNRDANWAASDFDRRHAIQGYFTLDLPFGRGRRWASDLPTALDRVVGGFEMAGIVRWYSGRPFTVYSGIGPVSQVVQSPASCNGCSPDMGGVFLEGGRNFFFTQEQRAMFFAPPAGELGNTGRNFFRGPSLFQLDMTVGKRIRFDEHRHLELRVEAQNLTNTPSFDFPTAVISNTNFGLIGGAVVSTSRKVQMAAKFNF
ncbi:MAG TPA: carboxypeptidase-like regulatory domain-containing protein [Pyrinomonadaceae bacterium]|nr:carboxypeptidase-like regulatory domain-containing protein [Pyrinomonadaceae bacterium]